MKASIKRALRWIVSGVPIYKIQVTTAVMDRKNRFKGHHALITGGSKGIGYAIAEQIINGGGTVVITARKQEDLIKAKQSLGESCQYIVFDVSHTDACGDLLNKASQAFGPIDVLVSNAGISYHESNFMHVTSEYFDDQIAVNLKGAYFLAQSYVKYYQRNDIKQGKILFMASETAGQPSYRPYSISKSALVFFMKWIAQEYATSGLRVNAIAPGITGSSMTKFKTTGEDVCDWIVGKRVLSPSEIAEVCAYVLSDSATSISGQMIACNEANVCFGNDI